MSMRARVLHLGSLPPPQGGIGTYLQGLLRSRVARQYELAVLEIGVPPYVRRHRVLRPILSARSLLGLVRYLRREQPDIVHVHVADFPGFWEKVVFARIVSQRGIPTLLHLHGGSLDRSLRRLTGRRAQWVSNALQRSSAVISPTSSWLPILKRFVPVGHVVVLPNAVHLEDFGLDGRRTQLATSEPGSTRSGVGTNASTPVKLLFLGMLSARKGMDDLLGALRILLEHGCVHFHLDVVGGEEVPGALRLYRERFHTAGLDAWACFHGERVGVEKLRFLESADIFVLPSRSESFGIANLEAMACGLPIVSTRTGAIPEYIEHGAQGLLVDPGDPSALAQALRRLIDAPSLRQHLGHAARARAREYSWDVVGARLDGLYAHCIGASRDGRSASDLDGVPSALRW